MIYSRLLSLLPFVMLAIIVKSSPVPSELLVRDVAARADARGILYDTLDNEARDGSDASKRATGGCLYLGCTREIDSDLEK